MRLDVGAFSFEEEEGLIGNRPDLLMVVGASGFEDPKGTEAVEEVVEGAGCTKEASTGWVEKADALGSVAAVEVVDAGGVADFRIDVINSETDVKDSSSALEELETVAKAPDSES